MFLFSLFTPEVALSRGAYTNSFICQYSSYAQLIWRVCDIAYTHSNTCKQHTKPVYTANKKSYECCSSEKYIVRTKFESPYLANKTFYGIEMWDVVILSYWKLNTVEPAYTDR